MAYNPIMLLSKTVRNCQKEWKTKKIATKIIRYIKKMLKSVCKKQKIFLNKSDIYWLIDCQEGPDKTFRNLLHKHDSAFLTRQTLNVVRGSPEITFRQSDTQMSCQNCGIRRWHRFSMSLASSPYRYFSRTYRQFLSSGL